MYEVELKMDIKAHGEKGVSFAVELVYCGLFGIRNVTDEQAHPFLYAEAPRLIFPFARRILADAVRDCGYAPLMLDPIDFNALYLQQRAQAATEAVLQDPPAGNA
jgi:preprotein translocase subunit SecB